MKEYIIFFKLNNYFNFNYLSNLKDSHSKKFNFNLFIFSCSEIISFNTILLCYENNILLLI